MIEPERVRDQLRGFIAREGGFDSVEIENLKRMAGGSVRESWSFDATLAKDGKTTRRALVLRRDLPGHKLVNRRRDEFLVLRAAHQEGVPVPEVLWLCEDPAVLGSDFFVMERIAGEAIARRLLRDEAYARAREVMPEQLAAILAQIHKIDLERHHLDFLPSSSALPARDELARCEEIFRELALEPHPAIELALRWLAAHMPKSSRRTLVHGDFRVGNFMFGPEGTRSILDWEFVHIGDPIEDVAWICVRSWRFGEDDKPVGGLAQREVFFTAYEKASGIALDREAAHFWEVFGNLRWAVGTISQARTAIDGIVPSVELASIGRRTAEMELELIALIE